MKTEHLGLASVAIAALVIAVWWAIRPPLKEEIQAPSPSQKSEPVSETEIAAPIPVPPVVDEKPGQTLVEVPRTSAPSESERLAKVILAFEKKSDPDPVLSRELEYVVQTAVNKGLDPLRFEIKSAKCRGNSCQLVMIDKSPSAGWSSASGATQVLKAMDSMTIRNPGTLEVLRPNVQEFTVMASTAVTMFSFDKPKAVPPRPPANEGGQ